jgi:hypothetical protein
MKNFFTIFFKVIFSIMLLAGLGVVGYIILEPLFGENRKTIEITFNNNHANNNDKEDSEEVVNSDYNFVVMSDSNGDGGSVQQTKVLKDIISEVSNEDNKPDFVIHNGDMIAGNEGTSKNLALQMWDEFGKATEPLAENKIGFFPSAGNHDASFNQDLPEAYAEYWSEYKNVADIEIKGLYGSYYSFEYMGSYFIVMYAPKINISDEQLLWLKNEVNKAQGDYDNIFVFSHIPLTAASDYHPDDKLNPNDQIKDILKDKITAFFGAHHNVYYDVVLDEIRQIGTGRAGSGGDYELKEELGGGSQDYYSYLKVGVDSKNIEVEQIVK